MRVTTFRGSLYPVNESNSISKTNLVSNQNTQTVLPASKLVIPDAALLKVSFAGSLFVSPEDRLFLLERKFGHDLVNCPNGTQIPKNCGGFFLADIKPDANLSGKNLIRFNFVKKNKTNILGINLSNSLLCYAILNGVTISDKEHKANLSGAILKNAELNGAELNKANLSKANLNDAELIDAKLNGANLNEANINWADLTKAELKDANLNKAWLYGANLNGACLNEAKMNGACLIESKLNRTKLYKVKLNDARLNGAELRAANLNRAKLIKADLIKAELIGANMTGADFKGANLNAAKLMDAELNGAIFENAWLLGVNFTDSKNINTAKFNGAFYNKQTKFPEEFNPKDHGMIFVPNDKERENESCEQFQRLRKTGK
ncbi:MAG: pentapeptide repeat-containing protein [Candidatus Gastranaerophilales bacterium]|nr:pentapeptide repeat-containing protein [Candidatus Gastranaerophilales bacterium]